MCGILGAINKNFDQNALELIKHRGPDSSGMTTFKVNEHMVVFSLARLAIVDLSETGHQPMITSCGNFAIVFNGEVYNHFELRKKLSNIEFKGHSDTETVLYYIKEFGIEKIKDLNGIFGLSFLDIQNQKLYLVRDHFGVKPVYWSFQENSLVFSSEIRPIQYILNDVKSDLDNLPTLLYLRYLPSPLTLYSGINKVRPGHYLEIDLTEKKLQPKEFCFISPVTKSIDSKITPLTGYSQKIEAAVKRQLMGDVEIGVLLSGGLDSAVVAALAQKHTSSSLKAFTIGFEGAHNEDEIEAAQETAELLGLDHYSKQINFEGFLSIIKETTRIIEEPLATTSVIPMYYLSEMASKYVKVVLTGQGADEPLGGYGRYQGELISSKIPRGVIRTINKLLPHLPIKNEQLLRAAHSLGETEDIGRFLKVYSVFQQDEIKTLLNVEEEKAFGLVSYFFNLHNRREIASVERMMAIDLRMNLADDLLLYTDKITMNFSLECRVPMLDVELIQYIESLPRNQRLAFRKTKIVHKQFAKNILPHKIINRKKLGFQSPTQIWFNKYNERIRNLLLSPSVFTEIFNPLAVSNLLEQHLKGYNREKQIFLLLGIYFWFENMEQKSNLRENN